MMKGSKVNFPLELATLLYKNLIKILCMEKDPILRRG